ncbi:AAA family ATPase [bacterium]|nr:AAA family ATPase [bacterium]
MKIRGWEIDGFGALRDSAVDRLPDGLTVVHGANEAGKTTLLEFLRRSLFGPLSNGAGVSYAPLGGGAYRGRLRVEGGDGAYVIARDFAHAALQVTRPDGSLGGAADLARLLGGADEKLFRAVFAIALDDLQSLAGLDEAAVSEALFSASLAGAGRSARAALTRLRAQAARRLDETGAAQIGACIAALNALRPRLAAARRAAEEYPRQRAAAAAAAAHAAALRERLAVERQRRQRAAALLRAWPLWDALQNARTELAAIVALPVPPPEVAGELQRARERLLAARGALDALRAEQAAAEAQRGLLPPDDGAAALAPEIDALCGDLTLHRFQLATLPAARARAEEAAATMRARLQRLDDAGTEAAVREWGRLGVDREQVRDWQVRLKRHDERARAAALRAEAAQRHRDSLREQYEAATAQLPARPPLPAEAVEARRQALDALRSAVVAMLDKRSRGEGMAQTVFDREQVLRAFDAERDAVPVAWLPPLLALLAAATVLATLWSAMGSMPAATLGASAAVALAAGAIHVGRQRRSALGRRRDRERARRVLRSELEAARRGRDQAWHAAAELAEQIARDGEALGLPRAPTLADCDAAAAGLDAEDAARVRDGGARAQLASLEPALRGAEEAYAARETERLAAEAARDEGEIEWRAWVERAGVRGAVDPELVLERVTRLQAAHEALLAHDAAERERRQLEPMVAAWETRARAVLARLGDASGGGEALVERIVGLRARLQEQAPLRQRRAALDAEVRERALRLAVASEALDQAERELTAVLARSGVRDEQDLLERRAAAARRQQLQRVVAEREALVAERVTWPEAFDDLARGAVGEWEVLAANADAVLAERERELDAADAAGRAAGAACAALERADEVPTLELEWAALTAELEEAVRDWRVLVAAAGFVEEAEQEFERTRQPAVLREASRAFATVTGERYERVAQDERAAALVVVERGGLVKQAGGDLSRGTAEALYLAVRLGLAGELARRGTALPLVMDDVLVNLDPERAAAMARVLGEVAQRHQVLFFTCHPSTRDLLVRAGHAARVVEL